MPERRAQLEQAVARRAFWRGTLSFGLVSIPVNLLSAEQPNRPPLRLVGPEGHPLGRRYYAARDNRPLDDDDIVRGYEVSKDRFVVLTDDELERLAPERTRDIDLRLFVDADRIDPMLFDRAYYLLPGSSNTTSYRLLARVLEDSGRAGIATFVMRTKEYLVAILAEGGILRAETLRFLDELRSTAEIGLPEPVEPAAAAVRRMRKAIAQLTKSRLDPRELVEESAQKLKKLAEKKARAGKAVIELPEEEVEEEQEPSVPDLFALLRRSVSGKTAAGERASAGSAGAELEGRSREELYEQAKRLDIPGRSSMSKAQLVRAIRRRRAA